MHKKTGHSLAGFMSSMTGGCLSLSQSSCLLISVLPVPIWRLVWVMLFLAYMGIFSNILSELSDRLCQIINRSLPKLFCTSCASPLGPRFRSCKVLQRFSACIGGLVRACGGSASLDPPYVGVAGSGRVDQASADPPYSRTIPRIFSGSVSPQSVL